MPQWLTGIAALAGVLISLLSLVITTIGTTKSTLEILAPRDMADIPGKSCRVEWVVTRRGSGWRIFRGTSSKSSCNERRRSKLQVRERRGFRLDDSVPKRRSVRCDRFSSVGPAAECAGDNQDPQTSSREGYEKAALKLRSVQWTSSAIGFHFLLQNL